MTDFILAAGDRQKAHPTPLKLGSEEHKAAFCRMLLDTHDPYRPALLDWPVLSETERDRVLSLPVWDMAIHVEDRAMKRVAGYGERVKDPLLRKAIMLDGFEEGRHRTVLSNLVEAYGISLGTHPEYVLPRDREFAFMLTGYGECIDSFFAFGLFRTAAQSGYFPPALVETFEQVMKEEGRHILFFVNWVAWHARNLPLGRRIWFRLKILAVWSYLLWERLIMAKSAAGTAKDNNFTATSAKSMGKGLSPAAFADLCLAENDRRLAPYDRRLIRPTLVPRLVRLARRFMGKAATTA